MRFVNSYKDKMIKYNKEKKLKYYIDTMGCQMNENDSLKYAGILESMGFEKGEENNSNLYLFNTCCVRENAENTLFGRLGMLKSRKLKNEEVYIAIVGCMTQQEHILEKIKKSYNYICQDFNKTLFKILTTLLQRKQKYCLPHLTPMSQVLQAFFLVYQAFQHILLFCHSDFLIP